jgi:hypothetical protein
MQCECGKEMKLQLGVEPGGETLRSPKLYISCYSCQKFAAFNLIAKTREDLEKKRLWTPDIPIGNYIPLNKEKTLAGIGIKKDSQL